MKKRKHLRLIGAKTRKPRPRSVNKIPTNPRSAETYKKMLSVLKRARRGENLREAIKAEHTTLRSARKYARRNIKQQCPHGICSVTQSDKLPRPVKFPIANAPGYEEIVVPGSEVASFIGHYWNDRGKVLLDKASPKLLEQYKHRAVYDTDNKPHYFVTDLATIKKLARGGYRGPGVELYSSQKSKTA